LERLAFIDKQVIEIRDQCGDLLDSLKDDGLRKSAAQFKTRMEAIHEQISATQPGEGGIPGQIRLREKIAEIYSAVNSYEGKPTNVQSSALSLYSTQVEQFGNELQTLISGDLNAFNQNLTGNGQKPVKTTTSAEFFKSK